MLTLLRTDFSSGLLRAWVAEGILRTVWLLLVLVLVSCFKDGAKGEEMPSFEGLGEGAEGVRSFEGGCEAAGDLAESEGTGRPFFDFVSGTGGRAVEGGLVAGRDGVGIVEAMVCVFR